VVVMVMVVVSGGSGSSILEERSRRTVCSRCESICAINALHTHKSTTQLYTTQIRIQHTHTSRALPTKPLFSFLFPLFPLTRTLFSHTRGFFLTRAPLEELGSGNLALLGAACSASQWDQTWDQSGPRVGLEWD
jgi:hypothetical protein